MKSKRVSINVPVIMTFRDYHEINYVKSYFNELLNGQKIKSKELPAYEQYAAIFYFNQDDEYKSLIKKYKDSNEKGWD